MIWIIALTANAMKGDRETYLSSGMQDYLSKPIHLKDLAATLRTYFETVHSSEIE